MKKQILVIAKRNKVEALRVGVGLTLVNDAVQIDVLGELEDSPEIREQLEVVDFAEIPYTLLDESPPSFSRLADDILRADVVYVI